MFAGRGDQPFYAGGERQRQRLRHAATSDDSPFIALAQHLRRALVVELKFGSNI